MRAIYISPGINSLLICFHIKNTNSSTTALLKSSMRAFHGSPCHFKTESLLTRTFSFYVWCWSDDVAPLQHFYVWCWSDDVVTTTTFLLVMLKWRCSRHYKTSMFDVEVTMFLPLRQQQHKLKRDHIPVGCILQLPQFFVKFRRHF